MLSDHCPACLSVYPVCNVGVLWPNGWMDQDETWHGGRPLSRPHCVRWGLALPQRGAVCPIFGSCLYIGWQWRNFFISADFRHFVGQALRNVCYSDVSRRHFLNNTAIAHIFLNQLIQFYSNNATNFHHLTTHSTTCWPTKWRSHCDHRYVTSLRPMHCGQKVAHLHSAAAEHLFYLLTARSNEVRW